MANVRVPEDLRLELAAMGLTVWVAHHPMVNVRDSVRPRANKEWVVVQLAGPGLEEQSLWGGGPTLRRAVDEAIVRNPILLQRVPGVRGSMFRLEAAILTLKTTLVCHLGPQELDDGVPF